MIMRHHELAAQLSFDTLAPCRIVNANARIRARNGDDGEATLRRAKNTPSARVVGVLSKKLDAPWHPPRAHVSAAPLQSRKSEIKQRRVSFRRAHSSLRTS